MSDPESPATPTEESAEPQWWEDPSLPWKHKPTKADIACFSWMGAVAVYSLMMLWLRPALLAVSPHVLAALGSWSGAVLVGAQARLGDPWWPLIGVLGTIGLIKFDWIYWWAGRLWGRELIEVWSGRSARARRINERAERFAHKYDVLALAVSMIPMVPGRSVIVAVLGEAGTSLTKFLTVSIISSAVVNAGLLAIGFWIGAPAVDVMKVYSDYLLWLSLALLAFVVISVVWKQHSKGSPSAQ